MLTNLLGPPDDIFQTLLVGNVVDNRAGVSAPEVKSVHLALKLLLARRVPDSHAHLLTVLEERLLPAVHTDGRLEQRIKPLVRKLLQKRGLPG